MFAISYDPVSALSAFASKYGITYPLLSDEGSRVIRELGLLNQHLAEQHSYYGVPTRDEQQGVPYPGVFVLDENGVIVEKKFEQSYRVRPTAVSLLGSVSDENGPVASARASAQTEDIAASFWLASRTYHPYQKLRLDFEVQIAPGLHVYGLPIPEGYTPLTIEIEPLDGMELGPVQLPEPQPFRVEGLDEEFRVYQGTVRGSLPVVLTKNLGEVALKLRLRYQACGENFCNPPGEAVAELYLTGLDLIRD